MIEITPAGLIAVVLATVFLTSMIWLGVAVILAGRDKTAERIDSLCDRLDGLMVVFERTRLVTYSTGTSIGEPLVPTEEPKEEAV